MARVKPAKNQEKAEVVKALRQHFPLEILLTMTGLKRSTFFYHLPSKSEKNAEIAEKILEIYEENQGNYGYRRVCAELRKSMMINHKKVQRIMQQLGLKGKCVQRKYRAYRGKVGDIADNLLQQDFQAKAPNEKWVTDVSEFKCKEGKLYLSPIKDLFNGEIIAYDISRSANFEQIRRMMGKAIAKLDGSKPILHSDQGWQYQMIGYQRLLQEKGIRQSMSRKGNCLDNSAMESFFGRLKTECYFGKVFESFEQLEMALHEYIAYYNNKRIQAKLNGLSPVAYRVQSLMR